MYLVQTGLPSCFGKSETVFTYGMLCKFLSQIRFSKKCNRCTVGISSQKVRTNQTDVLHCILIRTVNFQGDILCATKSYLALPILDT